MPDTAAKKVIQVQSDGYVIAVVDVQQALFVKACALKDLRDSWQYSTSVQVAMRQLSQDVDLKP